MDSITDLLECSICAEPFGDARFLRCNHTFCVDCIRKLPRDYYYDSIICPNCRQETILPSGRVSYLQKNFYVDKFKGALNDAEGALIRVKQDKETVEETVRDLQQQLQTRNHDIIDQATTNRNINDKILTLTSYQKARKDKEINYENEVKAEKRYLTVVNSGLLFGLVCVITSVHPIVPVLMLVSLLIYNCQILIRRPQKHEQLKQEIRTDDEQFFKQLEKLD